MTIVMLILGWTVMTVGAELLVQGASKLAVSRNLSAGLGLRPSKNFCPG
jgi:Ca2+/Na+ antiporter